jgi:hypothetical protein
MIALFFEVVTAGYPAALRVGFSRGTAGRKFAVEQLLGRLAIGGGISHAPSALRGLARRQSKRFFDRETLF